MLIKRSVNLFSPDPGQLCLCFMNGSQDQWQSGSLSPCTCTIPGINAEDVGIKFEKRQEEDAYAPFLGDDRRVEKGLPQTDRSPNAY